MEQIALNKLEYPKIIEKLCKEASTTCGKESAIETKPMFSAYLINKALDETTQAKDLLRLNPEFTLGGVHDTREIERIAKTEGIISPEEFLNLLDTLYAATRIREFFNNPELPYPDLSEMVLGVKSLVSLEKQIRKIITEEALVSSDATPELSRLRKKLKSLQGKAREKLESMIRNPEIIKHLQDPIISIRGDRFVIPVKADSKKEVPGIIHDQSSTGSTLFVEPIDVVEINNETAQTEIEEKAEVARILRELTLLVKTYLEEIIEIRECLTNLDVALAKAKLSYVMDAGRPEINEKGIVDLKSARHPLIKGKAVPVTVELGKAFDSIIVTGPNTGGKTVLLKTIGLLCLMAQSGLHIPAEYGSSVCIFNKIFCDIGDEQSIEQSLSTFSSHMTNIINITKHSDNKSLVLVDELGAGTDPAEGAALAMAIIDYLLATGAKLVATTHYSQLKSFASSHPRVENASVEFNVETLRPTYRLMIGIPGRSNAFDISTRLGLKDEIVSAARDFQDKEEARTSKLIKNLEENQIISAKEREEAENLKLEAEKTLKWIKQKEENANKKAQEKIDKANEEALEIITSARKEADALLKDIRDLKKEGLKVIDEEAAKKAREALKKTESKMYNTIEAKDAKSHVAPDKVEPGDLVLLRKLGQKATVISVDGSIIVVQAGIMKLNTKLSDLELIMEGSSNNRVQYNKGGASSIKSQKARTFSSELDLRGLLVDEAIDKVEKYLDDAYLSGVGTVSIIHGKGTGALRKAIRDMVVHHPFVTEARGGAYNEGGEGVTILEIKR